MISKSPCWPQEAAAGGAEEIEDAGGVSPLVLIPTGVPLGETVTVVVRTSEDVTAETSKVGPVAEVDGDELVLADASVAY